MTASHNCRDSKWVPLNASHCRCRKISFIKTCVTKRMRMVFLVIRRLSVWGAADSFIFSDQKNSYDKLNFWCWLYYPVGCHLYIERERQPLIALISRRLLYSYVTQMDLQLIGDSTMLSLEISTIHS
jgi:hypothetical protein